MSEKTTTQTLLAAISGLRDSVEALTVFAAKIEKAETQPALVKISEMAKLVPHSESWFIDRINDGTWVEGVHYYNTAAADAIRPTYFLDREEILRWVKTPAAERPLKKQGRDR